VTGSTILTAQNPNLLLEISEVDDLNNFSCIELDRMMTLDLEILADRGGVKWSGAKPIVYDSDAGMAIFKIERSGLIYLLEYPIDEQTEHREDLSKLVDFVRMHGIDRIYEFATF
jgi:hypothetical protein